ncbi:hypothetical protein JCGZ_05407 [Jatropha curcas]|uniref:Carboxypeptidase n=1 Tax=Jatropha curcas TaxID=180498 RepID=A0A067LH73_JATCU|nr:hypothetical protein JCGZ_05407 [Jatropha curcas]
MENVLLPLLFSLSLLFLNPLFHGGIAIAAKTKDGLEEWGYVQVRPKAHMFWWLYKSPYRVKNPSKPWPIILWLQGGPGASGVAIGNFEEIGPLDTNLKPRNSTWLQVADLLFVDNPVGTGFSFVEDLNLLVKSDREAATDLTVLLQKIFNRNKSLQESPLYIVAESYGGKFAVTLALSALKSIEQGKLKLKLGDLSRLDTINLKIANRFDAQSDSVFDEMEGDFMKPRINEVDELLAKGVNVTVYNGQLDLICSTKGTEAWVEKLRWKGIHNFRTKERTPLFCGEGRATKGFTKSYQNLHFYWILGAGHFVSKKFYQPIHYHLHYANCKTTHLIQFDQLFKRDSICRLS